MCERNENIELIWYATFFFIQIKKHEVETIV